MRLNARTIFTAMLMTGALSLAGCGGAEKGEKTVQMKDMEVVDGTASDAMTDLDGVQSEGTTMAMPAGNGSAGAGAGTTPATDDAAAPKAPADDAEVLSDQ